MTSGSSLPLLRVLTSSSHQTLSQSIILLGELKVPELSTVGPVRPEGDQVRLIQTDRYTRESLVRLLL